MHLQGRLVAIAGVYYRLRIGGSPGTIACICHIQSNESEWLPREGTDRVEEDIKSIVLPFSSILVYTVQLEPFSMGEKVFLRICE